MAAHSVVGGIVARLLPRQVSCVPNDGAFGETECYVPFWYTRAGIIIKWAIFLGLLVLFALYLILGYAHAKRRIRKGQPPLAYHRWLVPRSDLARVDPRFAYPAPQPAAANNYNSEYYGMQAMPPPPVYDPNAPRPPVYEPVPEGASKVDPGQAGVGPQRELYGPPSGPPPPAMQPQGTGSSNPFRH